MNIDTNRKCLELIGKAVGPKKGPRTHYLIRTEITNLIKEDSNARRFFESIQKLLSNVAYRAIREQQEKEDHEKAEKMLYEAHKAIINGRIQAYDKDQSHIQGISGQSLPDFLGWTPEEYHDYVQKGIIPERTKMPYPDIDVVVTKRKGST